MTLHINLLKPTHVRYYFNNLPCRIKCPKCMQDQHRKGRTSKCFTSTLSLTRHLRQNHADEKIQFPTFEDIFVTLEKITFALESNTKLNSIQKVVEWKMSIK